MASLSGEAQVRHACAPLAVGYRLSKGCTLIAAGEFPRTQGEIASHWRCSYYPSGVASCDRTDQSIFRSAKLIGYPTTVSTGEGGRSKVGIPGEPGNKSGPTVDPNNGSAAGEEGSMSRDNGVAAGSDESKVPGLPGNKSGPAEKMPSK